MTLDRSRDGDLVVRNVYLKGGGDQAAVAVFGLGLETEYANATSGANEVGEIVECGLRVGRREVLHENAAHFRVAPAFRGRAPAPPLRARRAA